MKKTTLKRDKVISVVKSKDLVGVYLKNDPDKLLLECSPEKANALIKIWNDKDFNKDKTEYLVIGSDNFWYGSGAKELKEAIAEVKDIKKGDNINSYADPETGFTRDTLPNEFYIYKAELVKEI